MSEKEQLEQHYAARDNPDYSAETASAAGGAAGHDAAYPPQQQPYYPPPPPGPPPPIDDDKQQIWPPPPGAPPDQAHAPQEPYFPPPPNYTPEAGPGLSAPQQPPLPPRPGSSQGQNAAPADPSASQNAPQKSNWGKKFYEWGIKAGAPINKFTNKLGSEAFWPTSIDKECDKAARILRSFAKDGFYTTTTSSSSSSSSSPPPPPPDHPAPSPGHPTSPGPAPKSKSASKTLVKIPQEAIRNARGLAIFTTFRTGFQFSGAGGSGVVVARLADGGWSPPSGFLVHTLGWGVTIGLDIYDCVCVLNTEAAVAAFTHPRVSFGGDVAVAAGPVGAGAVVEAAVARGAARPVWSYMKSRGLYAGVTADGTVVVERPDANAAFYGADHRLKAARILAGDVPTPGGTAPDGSALYPDGFARLRAALCDAEGRPVDARDQAALKDIAGAPTLGDMADPVEIRESEHEKSDMQEGVTRYG